MAYNQSRRNELARQEGYRNYSDKRNAQAKDVGFKNSYQQEKARSTSRYKGSWEKAQKEGQKDRKTFERKMNEFVKYKAEQKAKGKDISKTPDKKAKKLLRDAGVMSKQDAKEYRKKAKK
jgi:hypothetical protein